VFVFEPCCPAHTALHTVLFVLVILSKWMNEWMELTNLQNSKQLGLREITRNAKTQTQRQHAKTKTLKSKPLVNSHPAPFCNPGFRDWISLIPGLIPWLKQMRSDTVPCIQQFCYWSPWIVVSLRQKLVSIILTNVPDNGSVATKCQFHS